MRVVHVHSRQKETTSLECFHVHTSASRCQQHQLTCNICAPQTAPTPSPWNSASPPPPICELGNKMAATVTPPLLRGRTGERVRSSRWVCVFVVYCSRKWPSPEEEENNSCSWTTSSIQRSSLKTQGGINQSDRSQHQTDTRCFMRLNLYVTLFYLMGTMQDLCCFSGFKV